MAAVTSNSGPLGQQREIFGIFVVPAIAWSVKVQGALNRYWDAKSTPIAAPVPAV